jgi:hypothetical protein
MWTVQSRVKDAPARTEGDRVRCAAAAVAFVLARMHQRPCMTQHTALGSTHTLHTNACSEVQQQAGVQP